IGTNPAKRFNGNKSVNVNKNGHLAGRREREQERIRQTMLARTLFPGADREDVECPAIPGGIVNNGAPVRGEPRSKNIAIFESQASERRGGCIPEKYSFQPPAPERSAPRNYGHCGQPPPKGTERRGAGPRSTVQQQTPTPNSL